MIELVDEDVEPPRQRPKPTTTTTSTTTVTTTMLATTISMFGCCTPTFLAHLSLKLKLLFLFLLEPINKFVTTDIIKLNSRKTNVIGF